MNESKPKSFSLGARPRSLDLFLPLAAAALAIEMFLLRANVGLNLADEGFLWYGAQRVFLGEVPLRDFRAYDPGRYYWSALWFHLWRPGLVPLRFSQSVLQAAGLYFALSAAKRSSSDRWALAALGLLLTLWMYPAYKLLDCAIPLAAVYLGCLLLEETSMTAAAACGFFVGLCAFFGSNHALYAAAAFSVLFTTTCWKSGRSRPLLAAGAAGLAAGLLPLLALFLAAPGFFAAYFKVAERILRLKSTNIALPIPWPWQFDWPLGGSAHEHAFLMFRLLFWIIPSAFAYWLIRPLFGPRGRRVPGDIAQVCAVVGLGYLHYLFSRADFEHLTICACLFCLGLFGRLGASAPARRSVLALLLTLSFLSIGVESRLFQTLRPETTWPIAREVQGDRLLLDPYTAQVLEGAGKIAAALRPSEALLSLPHAPAIYAALGLKSPIWEIYSVRASMAEDQEDAILRLEKADVPWAIVSQEAVDGREDLRFARTNPILWNYLSDRYQAVPFPFLPANYILMRRAGPGQSGRAPPTGRRVSARRR